MNLSVAAHDTLVFGRNVPVERSLAKQACDNQGWKRMVNRPPSKTNALQRACSTVAQRTPIDGHAPLSVRALSQDLAFEVCRVLRGTTRNDFTHLFSVQVKDDGAIDLIACHASLDSAATENDLAAEYTGYLDFMSPSQVKTMVSRAVLNLKGVALGGTNVFYVPSSGVTTFQAWRDQCQLYSYQSVPLVVAQDPGTVQHIIDSLHSEVNADSQAVYDAIAAGSMEPKQAKRLASKAAGIVAKIKSYETALGQSLDWMIDPLEKAQQALAVAQLISVSV